MASVVRGALVAIVWSLVHAVGMGCGGGGSVPTSRNVRAVTPREDAAAELARSLPRGADRCAVARPGWISARRRPLLLRISQADALAWHGQAPITAYAMAEQTRSGSRARVMLVRVEGERERIRRFFELDAPMQITWADAEDDCVGRDCGRFVARFLSDNLVRIDRGTWVEGSRPGAEARCATLAASERSALEMSSRRLDADFAMQRTPHGAYIDTVLRARGSTLQLRRTGLAYRSETDQFLDSVSNEPDMMLALQRISERTWEEREGSHSVVVARIRWDDLQLLWEDDMRLRRAAAEDASPRVAQPVERVDANNITHVRQQVAIRSEALARLQGDARATAARDLRTLLERGLAANPGDERLTQRLVRLLIDELHDAPAAMRVVDAALGQSAQTSSVALQTLRREVAAADGSRTLARVLADDGVVPASLARRAAEDLIALTARGMSYELAEGLWMAASSLVARASRLPTRSVREISFPFRSLPETLVLLAEAGPLRGDAPHAVYMLVEGTRSEERNDATSSDSGTLVALHPPNAQPSLIGAVTTGRDPRLRDLGRALERSLVPGATRVFVSFIPLGAQEPVLVMRFDGHVVRGRLVMERVGGELRADWSTLARYVAEPLSAMEPRIFPPPELAIEAESTQEANRLAAEAIRVDGITCIPDERSLRCTALAQRPDAVYDLLRMIARGAIEEAGR